MLRSKEQVVMRIWMLLVLTCVFLISSWSSEHADVRDGQVLKAALEQLVPKAEKPSILILSEMTPQELIRFPSFPDVPQHRPEKLAQEEIKSLVENMVKRNAMPGTNTAIARRFSFADLDLGPQVVISSEAEKTTKEFREKHGSPNSWLEASLPGYSLAENRAVVCLRKRPESDGAVIRAFVENKDGRWRLLSMQIGKTWSLPSIP